MEQSALIESLSKHLGALASLVNWFIVTALTMIYSGIKREKTVEVAGLHVRHRDAFYLAALLAVLTQLGMILLLMRISGVLSLLDRAHFPEGFTRLATDSWLLNPFSFFGSALLARLQSAVSYFLFFVVLSLSVLPLVTMELGEMRFRGAIVLVLAATGAATALATWGVYQNILGRLRDVGAALYSALASTFLEKNLSLVLFPMILKVVRDAVVPRLTGGPQSPSKSLRRRPGRRSPGS
jgi:hypothetical protein